MKHLFLLWITFSPFAFCQSNYKVQEVSVNDLITGSLYTPETSQKPDLAILIAGSGPTDRDGNQSMIKNNSLKYLAQGLAKKGIAVYSYDKRLFALMKSGDLDESKLIFDDFIQDAIGVAAYFKKQKKYNHIIIIGHSEGALIGSVAAQQAKADGYISISGAGNPIDKVLEFQIKQSAPFLLDEAKNIMQQLKNGQTITVSNPHLQSLFRESVQPYMTSWLRYDPAQEIKKLNIPVMIVAGTSDIQVPSSEADVLYQAKPDARYLIVQDMNHVLKEVHNIQENQKAYMNPDLPIVSELPDKISEFINQIK